MIDARTPLHSAARLGGGAACDALYMKPIETRYPLKVASYNIHKCRGVDGVTRPDRIIGVIRELGADVIALQEVDRRFGRRGGLLDPSAIERETGMRLLVQSDVSHRHGWHGNALLVRGEPIILQAIAPEAAGTRAARSDRRRTRSRRRGVSGHRGSPRVAFVFKGRPGQRAPDRLPRSAVRCRPSCSAISTSGAGAGDLRCAGLNRPLALRRQFSAFRLDGRFSRSTGFSAGRTA